MKDYFSYDPENGLTFHATAGEARAAAERSLDDTQDGDDASWEDGITDICWGAIRGRAVMTARHKRPPAEEIGEDGYDAELRRWEPEWQEIHEYALCDTP